MKAAECLSRCLVSRLHDIWWPFQCVGMPVRTVDLESQGRLLGLGLGSWQRQLPARMKCRCAMLWVLLALRTVQVSSASAASPVDKVLSALSEMKSTGLAEMDAEKTQHAEFSAFCEKTLSEKASAIAEGKDSSEQLEAKIEKLQASISKLGGELQMHAQDILTTNKDTDDAKALRTQEAADFAATLKEYEESIDAIGRATQTLKDQDFSRPQAEKAALAQFSGAVGPALPSLSGVSAASTPKQLNAVLAAFLQADPKATGYDFQSGGVIKMLKQLKTKFQAEKADLEKTEATKKSSHELLMTSLAKQLTSSEETKAEKTQFKSKAEEDLATAKSDLEETAKTLAADTKYRQDLLMECKDKSEEFKKSQALRSEEIEAINMATEIISGKSVAGSAEKHMSGLLLPLEPPNRDTCKYLEAVVAGERRELVREA